MVAALGGFSKSIFTTDWGQVVAVWSEQGLWELSFPRSTVEEAMADIKTTAGELGPAVWSEQLQQELRLYLRGYNLPFTVPIDWRGYTSFYRAVLSHTAAIPYGRTETYGAVARAIGKPTAARAVGGAMHSNRTPIIVPCHRVIGSNGSLTGFGGGLDMKKALLLLEDEKNIVSNLFKRI